MNTGIIHCHTWASDGDLQSSDITQHNVKFVCATDHDSLDGYRYLEAAQEHDVEVIRGCELTVFHQHCKFHLLLLEPEVTPTFLDQLGVLQRQRKQRFRLIIAALETSEWSLELPLSVERPLPTKMDIFRHVFAQRSNQPLLEKHRLGSPNELKHFFMDAHPCPSIGIEASEILPHVKAYKILAHPAYSVQLPEKDEVVASFVREYSIPAMEVVTRKHDHKAQQEAERLASSLALMAITSNDVHLPEHLLWNQTPQEQLERLREKGKT